MESVAPLQCRAASAAPKSSAACRRRSRNRLEPPGCSGPAAPGAKLLSENPPPHGAAPRARRHRQQRVMTGPTVLAGVVSFQRAFLLSVTLEDGGVQIQTVALAAWRQALHLPLCQGIEQTMHVPHTKASEEIANGVVNGKARQAQHGMQSLVAP